MANVWRCLNSCTTEIDTDLALFSGTNGELVRVSVSYKTSELIGQVYLAER